MSNVTKEVNLFNSFDMVKNDYYDDVEHYTSIDAWLANIDTGIVIAKVHDDGWVEVKHHHYMKFPQIILAIAEVLNRIKNK